MGVPCFCNGHVLPKPVACLVRILSIYSFLLDQILYYFGLRDFQETLDPFANRVNIPAPVHDSAVIRSKLPVVEFGRLLKGTQGMCRDREKATCAVCLGWLNADDEVRELGNCQHAFHAECIDRWIDTGSVSCPLCRLRLLPCRGAGMGRIQATERARSSW